MNPGGGGVFILHPDDAGSPKNPFLYMYPQSQSNYDITNDSNDSYISKSTVSSLTGIMLFWISLKLKLVIFLNLIFLNITDIAGVQ